MYDSDGPTRDKPHVPAPDRLAAAFALAHGAHRTQTRKGSTVPYITHLMAVAALTGEYGGSEDQMIGALLHDAVEDGGGAPMRERIETDFGPAVAAIVDACTDTDETPKPPWRPRKEMFIASIAAMPGSARLVVAADKLHNTRSLIEEYGRFGDALWERFRGGREGTLWYYRMVAHALSVNWQNPILDVLNNEVRRLHTLAGESF